MSITRIARLRDYGVFRDFTWPPDLPEFGRYNLIYGWNGTGKTILSRLFRALEAKTLPSTGQVTLSVNGRDVSNAEFPQVPVAVRVFNRDFVQNTVFPTEGDVAPIYVLGEQNVETQKQVERLKASLAKAQADGDSNYGKNLRAEFDLDRFCIGRASVIKDTLRASGPNPYNNYDKSNFSPRGAGDDRGRRPSGPRTQRRRPRESADAASGHPQAQDSTGHIPAAGAKVTGRRRI